MKFSTFRSVDVDLWRKDYAMKPFHLWVAVFFISGVVGCKTASDPFPGFTGGFSDNDPIARASGHGDLFSQDENRILSLENGQHFDVGVGLQRAQYFDGQNEIDNRFPIGAMAFEKNGAPAQASSTVMNGSDLTWFAPKPDEIYWCNLYRSSDSALSNDSLSFSYQDFDGDSYVARVGIAPTFGKIVCPDTISASLGCHFTYDTSVPGDSIYISIQGVDSGSINSSWAQIDTGGFVIRPNQLRFFSSGYNLYFINFYRIHWTALISPGGKRIGIYSREETEAGIPVKP
ncbi:MAG TPA: hypothetical protein VG537_08975 [Candidatus Kapabacteria bacterium]|jgi:hypothetical protein|nr:hypothetical protein [Candidatus Kapabacteria bacterium]